jgi:alkylhydroperoxidase/carboxymuconolactone decarboxylase family protein YurZ
VHIAFTVTLNWQKAAGATDAQIKEAIATAALVRFNSTMLNGSDGGRDADTVFTSK